MKQRPPRSAGCTKPVLCISIAYRKKGCIAADGGTYLIVLVLDRLRGKELNGFPLIEHLQASLVS